MNLNNTQKIARAALLAQRGMGAQEIQDDTELKLNVVHDVINYVRTDQSPNGFAPSTLPTKERAAEVEAIVAEAQWREAIERQRGTGPQMDLGLVLLENERDESNSQW